ncbi:MAG: RNase adapter RapZ [Clostridiales Family XIII bacterium]|jgi:UPF0042 nucleotide-binding protein|nr:RNase adapter RapZ [Clostridiales Family XIII bacterium]
MEIIIITGMSGAGKSLAADCFEDIGYYCIDNLPPSLIRSFLGLISKGKRDVCKAAFVVDIRGGEFFDELLENLTELDRDGTSYRILFLDASDEVILRRFSESRRSHPLAQGTTNAEAVQEERKRLEPIRRIADCRIDTTKLRNAALAEAITTQFLGNGKGEAFKLVIQSFGYKYGIPAEVDILLDVRFIPNPFYVDSLKKLTGNSKRVRDYVMRAPEAAFFAETVMNLLRTLMPAFEREGKHSLNVAFGCTGGQHRSVAMANILYAKMKDEGTDVVLTHRDI